MSPALRGVLVLLSVTAATAGASPAFADSLSLGPVSISTSPGATLDVNATTTASTAGSVLVYDDTTSSDSCAADSDAEEARGASYVQTVRYDSPVAGDAEVVSWTLTSVGKHALCAYLYHDADPQTPNFPPHATARIVLTAGAPAAAPAATSPAPLVASSNPAPVTSWLSSGRFDTLGVAMTFDVAVTGTDLIVDLYALSGAAAKPTLVAQELWRGVAGGDRRFVQSFNSAGRALARRASRLKVLVVVTAVVPHGAAHVDRRVVVLKRA